MYSYAILAARCYHITVPAILRGIPWTVPSLLVCMRCDKALGFREICERAFKKEYRVLVGYLLQGWGNVMVTRPWMHIAVTRRTGRQLVVMEAMCRLVQGLYAMTGWESQTSVQHIFWLENDTCANGWRKGFQ